jgi:5-methylthioadenosine/S-adenosylhomocysteine deaminase
MKTVIQNGIGFWPPDFVVRPMNLLIDGDTIEQVSENQILAGTDTQVFDVQGKLVIPGLVDGHTHLAQSFGRGIYDNLHLTDWLVARSWDRPLYDEEIYAASLLGAVEALRTGTTTVAEMTTVGDLGEIVIQAISDGGLRAVVCTPMGDHQEGRKRSLTRTASQALEAAEKTFKNWHGKADGRITMRISPVGLPACTEELMRGSRALADQLGVGLHTHCCEGETETANSYERFGISEVEVLQRCGVLGTDT